MVAVRKPLTGRRGSKKFEPSDLFRVVQRGLLDDLNWDKIGIVVVPDGETSHFTKVFGPGGAVQDVLVHVETVPDGQDLTCRLTAAAGGAGIGLWRIPSVGTEVGISLGDGKIDFMPRVVTALSTGGVHERVSDERTILVADDEIEIIVGNCTLRVTPSLIQLGANAAQGLILGTLYKADENIYLTIQDTFLTTLSTYITAIAPIVDPGATLTPPMLASIVALKAAITAFKAGVHVSTKSKTE